MRIKICIKIFPNRIVSSVQQKAWMDDKTKIIWFEKVLKVHLNNFACVVDFY